MIRALGDKVPKIHPTAFVSESAYVVGDVEIGPGSSIWHGVVIRANKHKVTIGANVNIQDGSVIHTDSACTFGDNTTLGHLVMCQAKYVGSNTLLGNGAIVNNEASIGSNSIIASGAVVLGNVIIPDDSFVVGAPAKVVKQTDAKHHEMIKRTSENYYENGQIFLQNNLQDPDQHKFT